MAYDFSLQMQAFRIILKISLFFSNSKFFSKKGVIFYSKMKSIKKLNSKLQKIEEYEKQMKKFSKLEDIAYLQFIKYKRYMKKKQRIEKEKKIVERFAKGCELLYKYDTNRWISDPNINCSKFCKLEEKANYRKDLKLYRCGLIDKRPTSLKYQNLKNSKLFNNIFFKKVHKILENFNSNVLPQKINRLAVSTAKLCIKGYRKIQSDYVYMRKYASTKKSVKYIEDIFNCAYNELEQSNVLPGIKYEEQCKRYRESLRVKPNNNIQVYKNSKNENKGITMKRKNIAIEYDM